MANWPTIKYPHERDGGYPTKLKVYDKDNKFLFEFSGNQNLSFLCRVAKDRAKKKFDVKTGVIKGEMQIRPGNKESFTRKF